MYSYLFAYGSLLRGETNNHILRNCILVDYTSKKGFLYDTCLGYPAAVTDRKGGLIWGELYLLPSDNHKILERLDGIEETRSGLFRRETIKTCSNTIYCYTANSVPLKKQIPKGSWLRYNSTAKTDPVKYAVEFESSQKKQYRMSPVLHHPGYIYLPGDMPILISAPHSTNHKRGDRLKRFELYTSAISSILHCLTGVHVLYSNFFSGSDPNYYDDSPYKNFIRNIVHRNNITTVIDIHGTGQEKVFDIYPGIGYKREFLHGDKTLIELFYNTALKYGITYGDETVFPAFKQKTVSRFCARKLGATAMQLEINKRLRKPLTDPVKFRLIIDFLTEFIKKINKKRGTEL